MNLYFVSFFIVLNIAYLTVFHYVFMPIHHQCNTLINELTVLKYSIKPTTFNPHGVAIKLKNLDKEQNIDPYLINKLDISSINFNTFIDSLNEEIYRLRQLDGQSHIDLQSREKQLQIGFICLAVINILGFSFIAYSISRKNNHISSLRNSLGTSRAELANSRNLIKRKTLHVLQLRKEHSTLHEKFLLALKEAELDPKGTGALVAKAGMNFFYNTISQNLGHFPIWVLMIDADKFKNVNDSYGHRAGDIVLETLVKCIKDDLREADFVFRYGGEEFVIILTGGNSQEAWLIAERLRTTVEQTPIWIGNQHIHITFSAGLAECSQAQSYMSVLKTLRNKNYSNVTDESNKLIQQLAQEVIEVADSLLYTAKKSGRNQICTLTSKLKSKGSYN